MAAMTSTSFTIEVISLSSMIVAITFFGNYIVMGTVAALTVWVSDGEQADGSIDFSWKYSKNQQRGHGKRSNVCNICHTIGRQVAPFIRRVIGNGKS